MLLLESRSIKCVCVGESVGMGFGGGPVWVLGLGSGLGAATVGGSKHPQYDLTINVSRKCASILKKRAALQREGGKERERSNVTVGRKAGGVSGGWVGVRRGVEWDGGQAGGVS